MDQLVWDVLIQRDYGLTQVPSLVFFETGVPKVGDGRDVNRTDNGAQLYMGDLKNDDETLAWISEELSKQEIKEVRLNNVFEHWQQNSFTPKVTYSLYIWPTKSFFPIYAE